MHNQQEAVLKRVAKAEDQPTHRVWLTVVLVLR